MTASPKRWVVAAACAAAACASPPTVPPEDGGVTPDGAGSQDAGPADGSGDGADAGHDAGTLPDGGGVLLRIAAANLTSGNNLSYEAPGIRILEALNPDIVLIQEFNYADNSPASIRQFVDAAFGSQFAYYRESEPSDSIPNGVISRHPIVASGEWADSSVGDRDFAWARIDIPGSRDVWAVSLHLWGAGGSTGRNGEATQILGYVQQFVPAGVLLVIGGDLNTDSRGESCITTLSAVVNTQAPWPADQAGNSHTNAPRSRPYDWVMADPDLHPLLTATAIGSNRFGAGLVFDSRVYSPLSDVAPVQSTDSGANNMQHMAVVRDFLIPP